MSSLDRPRRLLRALQSGLLPPVLAVGCSSTFVVGLFAGLVLSPWLIREDPEASGGDYRAPIVIAEPQDRLARTREVAPPPSAREPSEAPLRPEHREPTAPNEILPAPPPPSPEVERAVGESEPVDPLTNLIGRGLTVPVLGVRREDLRDSFDETRGDNRRHEAIDILAPRGTPVLAVEDGTIAKLFLSHGGGGKTIYQFDGDGVYAYYYAHLERYAEGLTEGATVHRGQVIGFVGTSGNAPPDTPHLHFAVYLLEAERNWWEGDPVNPFDILRPGEPTPGR